MRSCECAGVACETAVSRNTPIRARNSREDGMDNGLNAKLETASFPPFTKSRVSFYRRRKPLAT